MPKVRDLEADYPKRISSHVAVSDSKWNQYWHGDEKWHYLSTILDATLQKSIGRNVDEVFSEYCKKFEKGWESFDYRRKFWDEFRPTGLYVPDYYLEGKIIRKREKDFYKGRKHRTKIVGGHKKEVMMFTEDYGHHYYRKIYDKQAVALNFFDAKCWDHDRYFEIADVPYIIEEMTDYYRTHPNIWIREKYGWGSNTFRITYPEEYRKYLEYSFTKKTIIVDAETLVFTKKEWKKLHSKNIKSKHHNYKLRKANARLKAQDFGHTLWIKKKTRQSKLHENEDIITRDRLGFDEYSFKGEFYHGCKRKKKSS